MKQVCSVETCPDLGNHRGFCNKHYKKWRKYGDPLGDRTWKERGEKAVKICSVNDCSKPVRARECCASHYTKLLKYGDPLGGAPPRDSAKERKVCAVESCERVIASQGWCKPHYDRWIRYGDPEAGGRVRSKKTIVARKLCAWPKGCKKLERARGFCSTHYQLVRHNPKLEHLLPEDARSDRCIASLCEYPQYAKGYCRKHYAKLLRGQNPLAEEEMSPVDYKTFGGRIFALRAARGWTLDDVAERVGLSRERIRQLEKLATPPRSDTIGKFADSFGVDVSVLLGHQLPDHIGRQIKEDRSVIISKHVHLPCLWCGGRGELPLSLGNGNAPMKTMCAYCRGSGAVYISPAPALVSRTEERVELSPQNADRDA